MWDEQNVMLWWLQAIAQVKQWNNKQSEEGEQEMFQMRMERKGRAGDKRSGRDKEELLWTTAATRANGAIITQ